MAVFDTKLGRLLIERSEKEDALNVGVESDKGSGFLSLPFGKRELLHAAGVLGAAAALRGLHRRSRGENLAIRDIRREEKRAQGEFGKRGGFGGGKRAKRKKHR